MNNRLKELREALDLSQNEFANKLNLQRNSVSLIENGKRNLSRRTIIDICEKFNVNEEWLCNGTGEMFRKDEKSLIDKLAEQYQIDDFLKSCLETLVKMDLEDMKVLSNYLKDVAQNYAMKQSHASQQKEDTQSNLYTLKLTGRGGLIETTVDKDALIKAAKEDALKDDSDDMDI